MSNHPHAGEALVSRSHQALQENLPSVLNVPDQSLPGLVRGALFLVPLLPLGQLLRMPTDPTPDATIIAFLERLRQGGSSFSLRITRKVER